MGQLCRCTRNTHCTPFLRSTTLCPVVRPILTLFLASSRLPSPPSVALSLTGQPAADRSSVAHRRWLLEAGCSLTRAESLGWRYGGGGGGDQGHIPQRSACCTCACAPVGGLIACRMEREPIRMDRGARGRERRGRRNRCKKIGDAKMRFRKTRPVFPCAAHANSFTRVPGRNAAVCVCVCVSCLFVCE